MVKDTLEILSHFIFYIGLLFTLVFVYKVVYIIVAFKARRSKYSTDKEVPLRKYAFLIPARNEELVIGQLIESIKNQNYPKEMYDIFVIADNCTDNTAQIARESGAIVAERFNEKMVGKGYALKHMLNIIEMEYSSKNYDGYFVFDADNLLDENYIFEMNKTFNQGYRVITSYRNSKNYDQNWITSGYALWFLYEAEFLNRPRMFLKTSCAVSGTGFLVNADVFKENGGWVHHLLTEDIEFTVAQIIKGEKIGYCSSAVFYDEQPSTFSQSWKQRLRWAKGFYQVFMKYGKELSYGMIRGKGNKFSCFDMMMTVLPVVIVSILCLIGNVLILLLVSLEGKGLFQTYLIGGTLGILWIYGLLFALGLITTIMEWDKIRCPNWKKIFFLFTFPLFLFTYLPISIVALFKKIEWKPIPHTVVKSLDDLRQRS
ncbi:glycosyltransferase family 2 protein [Terribacillus saccharophilus]|uniref:glycosyltransferase family 2 protein n=1 Tax=Terribacillus saccharophilus TaxID=361277 RepID=UPI000C99DF19|nr:glycosyltransferase family 2 protein [Terribacillus goriensis]